MSYQRLAYEDQDSTVKMHTDCAACASEMGIPARQISLEVVSRAPSIGYAGFTRETSEARKPEINVSDAAAHLAARMHLHLS